MHKNIKNQLVKALQSGKYHHNKGALLRFEKSGKCHHCVMGVIMDLAIKAGLPYKEIEPDFSLNSESLKGIAAYEPLEGGKRYYYNLPAKVRQWAGINRSRIIQVNDKSKTGWNSVVAYIKKHWREI